MMRPGRNFAVDVHTRIAVDQAAGLKDVSVSAPDWMLPFAIPQRPMAYDPKPLLPTAREQAFNIELPGLRQRDEAGRN
jgi:hypothetical protein